ncbi:hypothetical protein GOP47_0024403 [Adiantum capillus-veneris]|uniref:protein-serine/threonine phosphatase n=1 Tax=Adiantum capillus-veneris TaxID=13818 RepID=A0A9D4U232_ADICA|nr:hypothetical protein GOP47_0024403 [Adiantum capillus-veneris]
MSLANPLPPSSPAPFLNIRISSADHQDHVMHSPFSRGLSSSSSSSPRVSISPAPLAPHNRSTVFGDLFSPRSKLYSTAHIPALTKALSSPRSLSSFGFDARKAAKENRENACGSQKSGSSNRAERKRPARLAIPESARLASLGKAKQFVLPEQGSDTYQHEVELFAVAAKRGRKERMEDSYTAATNFHGNPKQAFFGVFDGHGGKHAAEFAAANLSRHVSAALQHQKDAKTCTEDALLNAYRNTDAEFLNQRLSSGACAVSVLLNEGEMVVANTGDCKVVLCRGGKAESLSTLHRASNEVERQRIEDLGGFVDCYNGTWRLQGTLAVTRGFGDAHLKSWVSAEPATMRKEITSDCEFLILASDGLWDQMSDQEVVDCARSILMEADKDNILRPISKNIPSATQLSYVNNKEVTLQGSPSKTNACNELIRIACHRGNRDDITVMIVPLKTFAIPEC